MSEPQKHYMVTFVYPLDSDEDQSTGRYEPRGNSANQRSL
jgi:hypothetical protein